MFDIENITESSGNGSNSKYLTKGINQNVTIGTILGVTPGEGRSPYISITLFKSNSTEEEGGRDFKLYMSDKAKTASLTKLLHLAGKVVPKESIVAADKQSSTLEDFCVELNRLMKGQSIRWFKLAAEQYMNANQEIKDRVQIGFVPFAEQGETCTLTYDESKEADYRKLPVPEVSEGTSDLPF